MSNTENPSKSRRFWRGLAAGELKSPKPVNLTKDLSHLSTDQRNERRQALKNMLLSNEIRQKGALRSRRPSMSKGQRVAITSGPFQGRQGIVLDADFINSRVQLEIDDTQEPEWLSFKGIRSVQPVD